MIHSPDTISNGSQGDHKKCRDEKAVPMECHSSDEKDMQHPCNKDPDGGEGKADPYVGGVYIPDQEYRGDQQHRDER